MGKTLYLECGSGISGDMTVAALLDLGADREELERVLKSLPVEGFDIEIKRVKKSGLDACDFSVKLDAAHENHDHDMEYLHGKGYEEGCGHEQGHGDGTLHGHEHGHGDAAMEVHEHSHGDVEVHRHSHGDAAMEVHDHSHGDVDEHEHNHGDVDEHGHSHGDADEHGHVALDGHGHDHGDVIMHVHEHSHGDGGVHEHGHGHPHDHVHTHEHRGLREIIDIIEKTRMHPEAQKLAVKIFRILGEAEAKAHGVSLEEVHFHEVGAVDSIVDIVAAAVCFQSLGITDVIIPEISEGKGQVRCQHGIIPVPVPAVVNIVSAHGLPLHMTDTFGELVTPTGAAIAAAIRTGGKLPERFIIKKVGLGAGKRKYERPSLLRAMLISPVTEERTSVKENVSCQPEKDTESRVQREQAGSENCPLQGKRGETGEEQQDSPQNRDRIYRLETNIDDSTGEQLGYVMERLLAAGARDVHYTPVFMKKNRPGYQLNVICDEESVPELENIIFRETTTIGIRRMELERHVLPRAFVTVSTAYGDAKVKVCTLPDGEKRYYPEYGSAAELAEKSGVSLAGIYEEIRSRCPANDCDSI